MSKLDWAELLRKHINKPKSKPITREEYEERLDKIAMDVTMNLNIIGSVEMPKPCRVSEEEIERINKDESIDTMEIMSRGEDNKLKFLYSEEKIYYVPKDDV